MAGFEKVEYEFPEGDLGEEETVEIELEPSSALPLGEEAPVEDETEVEIEAKEAEEEVELEIIDDVPEADRGRKPSEPPEEITEAELENYSGKVRKRINHFSKGYHDERRAKEAAERESNELKNLAESLMAENRGLKDTVGKNHTALLEQAKQGVSVDLEAARTAYRTAYEEGDSDALLEAQEALTDARLTAQRLESLEEETLQRQENGVQQTEDNNPVRTNRVQPDTKAVSWKEENQWFGSDDHRPETAYALGVHQQLVEQQGVSPDSEEYYSQLNASMQKTFPDLFEDTKGKEKGAPKRTNNVVAPATRSTAPKKIRLTQTQVALAKRLGLTPTQYAKQVAIDMRTQRDG